MDGFLPNLTYTIDTILENSKFEVLKPEEREEIRDFLLKLYYNQVMQDMVNNLPEDKLSEFQDLTKENGNLMDFFIVNVQGFNDVFEQATAKFVNELISVCIFNEEYSYGS